MVTDRQFLESAKDYGKQERDISKSATFDQSGDTWTISVCQLVHHSAITIGMDSHLHALLRYRILVRAHCKTGI